MTTKTTLLIVFVCIFVLLQMNAYALQEHGATEGLLVHQGAHILFFLAMCDFSYRILRTQLFAPLSRRYLFGGAVLLALWNLWAFTGHILASRFTNSPLSHQVGNIFGGTWHITSITDLAYYILKMDDLLLAPAILFFFLASRQIIKEMDKK